jgi:hypothetical protein
MGEFLVFANLSFVVPIEASEVEVEFFLRRVECDTQFFLKKKVKVYFSFFFFLPCSVLSGLGVLGGIPQ